MYDFWSVLGVLDEYIKIAIAVEDAGIKQLILHVAAVACPIGLDQVPVWKGLLRILVQILHVRVSRSAVQIIVVFLDIFAVIALTVGESEQAFLQDGVLAVPHGQGEAQQLLVIADASQPVLTPVISPRSRRSIASW